MRTRAISVQYVDLVDRIFVNSERSEPVKPARPAGPGSGAAPAWRPATGVVVVAIVRSPLLRAPAACPVRAVPRRGPRHGTARWRRSAPWMPAPGMPERERAD